MFYLPWLPPLLLFCAFLLLLLVSLSVPIIKTISIFSLSANFEENIVIASGSATGHVNFGVWGYCVSAVDVSASVIGIGSSIDIPAECSSPQLGYTFDQTVATALNALQVPADVLSSTLTSALVINPIACSLVFLALVFSLSPFFPRTVNTRLASILTLSVTLFAALLTTVVFLVNVIVVAVARSHIHSDTDGAVTGTWGAAVWMTLGATVALWAACVGTCGGILTRRTKNRTQGTY